MACTNEGVVYNNPQFAELSDAIDGRNMGYTNKSAVDNVPQFVEQSDGNDGRNMGYNNKSVLENVPQSVELSDGNDGRNMGYNNKSVLENVPQSVDRPDAPQVVSANSRYYNIRQDKRGYAIIFKHENYDSPTLQHRECAAHDAMKCKETFEALRFDVIEYSDLRKNEFLETIDNICNWELNSCDCLVVIFMSHGCEERDKEYIWLRDNKVLTSTLWNSFTADKCKQMAGKPKLFFIQACRGETTDKGIRMKREDLHVKIDCYTCDSVDNEKHDEDYVIPRHADMLMMWASYPGMYAFRTQRDGISGSVFLHFLCQVLLRDYEKEDLSSMLRTVTRDVAIHYESSHLKHHLNNAKQMPYTVSTLMRDIFFGGQHLNNAKQMPYTVPPLMTEVFCREHQLNNNNYCTIF